MSLSIVFGGQWGSEGKGKAAHYFARELNASAAVRVGGVNSGHTVYDDAGEKHVFQILPTAAILDNVVCVLPAGSYIDLDILHREIEQVNLSDYRLKIDENAMIVTNKHQDLEASIRLNALIGSTLSGTGAAVIERIRRDRDHLPIFAKDVPELKNYIIDTKKYLRSEMNKNHHVVIEGTQGYGLSVLHSKDYPYATSRDTSAAGFLSETGLSPFDVENVIMVIRAFPIRVAGNSGPLPDEIDWNTITQESKSPNDIIEYTTVTKKIRRVARLGADMISQSITANNPNIIVMNHLDYIDYSSRINQLNNSLVSKFINDIEVNLGKQINYLGFDPCKLQKR